MKIEERSIHKTRSAEGQFPESITTEAGIPLIVRPIRPEDKPQLLELLKSLSSQSLYLRFFSPIRNFSESMIHRLTHVDCRFEIVLVALDLFGNMLGKSTICILEDELIAGMEMTRLPGI